jgi:ATP-dependent protease ClpP protease subunit
LIKPNPNYRADPSRSIFVQGEINQSLVDRVTPQIVSLHGQSRDPITVYIDSPGGSTAHQQVISRLLRASDQNLSEPCKIVTVVTGRAASAASDLLCSGDYAIAYQGSSIFFHGTSRSDQGPMTIAAATQMTKFLRFVNDSYALAVADNAVTRFGFRYVSQQDSFADFKSETGSTQLPDLDCFLGLISKHLSPPAKKLVADAKNRNSRYITLIDYVSQRAKRSKRFTEPKREAETESAILKAIIDFELSRNKKASWTFKRRGMDQIHADFLLVNEYLNIYDSDHLGKLCNEFGRFLETDEESEALNRIEVEEDRYKQRTELVKAKARPIWLFFVALCYSLQEDDNDLRATDAFWLGLIDEVMGDHNLFPSRLVKEYVKNPVTPPS